MKTVERLTVIVVSYHTGASLLPMLQSVLASTSVTELIVINNGNPPDALTKLQQLEQTDSRLCLLSADNIGFAKACNWGAQQAIGQQLLFLNPDMLVGETAIERLQQTYCDQQKKLTASVDKVEFPPLLLSGFIVDSEGREQRGLRRNLLTPSSLFIEVFYLDKLFPRLASYRFNLPAKPQTQLKKDTPIGVNAISGACMLISNKDFQKLGGFDEGYFLHVEDLDFCRHLKALAGQIWICPAARFIHYGGSSEVAKPWVEKHKRDGFRRYFKTHHRWFWVSPLGWLLQLLIELKYWRSWF